MKMHKVNFEGTVVKMPFLSVEDCEGNAGLLVGALRKIDVPSMPAGICYELHKSRESELHEMVRELFSRTMPAYVNEPLPAYVNEHHLYLPAYVNEQLGRDWPLTPKERREQCCRIRAFWIAHQIKLLEPQ